MSDTAVLLFVACAAFFGIAIGWFVAKRGAGRLEAALEEAKAAAKSKAAGLRDKLAEAQRKLDADGASRKQAEEATAMASRETSQVKQQLEQAEQAKATAEQKHEQLQQQLQQAQGELEQAIQQAKSLDADLQRAHSKPSSTLQVLKNDPALGPGQYETLKLMYEQFSAKSVLGGKTDG